MLLDRTIIFKMFNMYVLKDKTLLWKLDFIKNLGIFLFFFLYTILDFHKIYFVFAKE